MKIFYMKNGFYKLKEEEQWEIIDYQNIYDSIHNRGVRVDDAKQAEDLL